MVRVYDLPLGIERDFRIERQPFHVNRHSATHRFANHNPGLLMQAELIDRYSDKFCPTVPFFNRHFNST
jgi:hypothetical protein